MQTFNADLAIIGAGGAGLRAAIAAAEANPQLKIALISKVYPMRSHTVAAEGLRRRHSGSRYLRLPLPRHRRRRRLAVRTGRGRSLRASVPARDDPARAVGLPVEPQTGRFGQRAALRRHEDRTHWFAADKTGFHMLHTLFQTSLKYPQIQRFDEHFVLDIPVDDGVRAARWRST